MRVALWALGLSVLLLKAKASPTGRSFLPRLWKLLEALLHRGQGPGVSGSPVVISCLLGSCSAQVGTRPRAEDTWGSKVQTPRDTGPCPQQVLPGGKPRAPCPLPLGVRGARAGQSADGVRGTAGIWPQ